LSADEGREAGLWAPNDTVSFALGDTGPLRLTVGGLPKATLSAITKRMDPYRAGPQTSGARSEVVLRKRDRPVSELIETQRPAGDGLTTGFDGSDHHLLDGDSILTLPSDPIEGDTYEVDEDFDIGRAWRRVVLPALQMAALRAGGVAVHSSSVQIGGRGIVVAGKIRSTPSPSLRVSGAGCWNTFPPSELDLPARLGCG
jgi:hypothetical protein